MSAERIRRPGAPLSRAPLAAAPALAAPALAAPLLAAPRLATPLLAALLTATAAGCAAAPGSDAGAGPARTAAVRAAAEDLGRAFETDAARARNELEDARRAAEALLEGTAAGRETAERARARARRALLEGSAILEEAARRGGHAAESWARLIQDRMMRLEESIRALGGTGREHASS